MFQHCAAAAVVAAVAEGTGRAAGAGFAGIAGLVAGAEVDAGIGMLDGGDTFDIDPEAEARPCRVAVAEK